MIFLEPDKQQCLDGSRGQALRMRPVCSLWHHFHLRSSVNNVGLTDDRNHISTAALEKEPGRGLSDVTHAARRTMMPLGVWRPSTKRRRQPGRKPGPTSMPKSEHWISSSATWRSLSSRRTTSILRGCACLNSLMQNLTGICFFTRTNS